MISNNISCMNGMIWHVSQNPRALYGVKKTFPILCVLVDKYLNQILRLHILSTRPTSTAAAAVVLSNQLSLKLIKPHFHVGFAKRRFVRCNAAVLDSTPPLRCACRCLPSRTWPRSWRPSAPWSPSPVTCCAPCRPCSTSGPRRRRSLRRCCAKARSATRAGKCGRCFSNCTALNI